MLWSLKSYMLIFARIFKFWKFWRSNRSKLANSNETNSGTRSSLPSFGLKINSVSKISYSGIFSSNWHNKSSNLKTINKRNIWKSDSLACPKSQRHSCWNRLFFTWSECIMLTCHIQSKSYRGDAWNIPKIVDYIKCFWRGGY